MSDFDDLLAGIGEFHVTFAYATALAARAAFERTERRVKGCSIWRHKIGLNSTQQLVSAIGEDEHEVEKARRLLANGGELFECPADALESLRNRRRARAVEVAKNEAPVRTRTRYGERGAIASPDGEIIVRRTQG